MSDNDILARAKSALDGVTDGPWVVDDHEDREHNRITVGAGTFLKTPGCYDTTDLIHEVDTYCYDLDESAYITMMADAAFIAAARTLLPELIAEVEKLRRGGKTLGQVVERQCQAALDATGLHHLIDETGDGDWGAVWENLAELRIIAARVAAIREFSDAQIAHDARDDGALTDRAWCAQSVLNILAGNIDEQILAEHER